MHRAHVGAHLAAAAFTSPHPPPSPAPHPRAPTPHHPLTLVARAFAGAPLPQRRLLVVHSPIREAMSNSTRPAMGARLPQSPTTGLYLGPFLPSAEPALRCSSPSCLPCIDCDVLSLLPASSRWAAGEQSPPHLPCTHSLSCKWVDTSPQKSCSPRLKPKATRRGLTQNVTKSETEGSMSRRPFRTKIEPFGVMCCM